MIFKQDLKIKQATNLERILQYLTRKDIHDLYKSISTEKMVQE